MAVYPEKRSGRLTGVWIAEVERAGKRYKNRFSSHKEASEWCSTVAKSGPPPPKEDPPQPTIRTWGELVREARPILWPLSNKDKSLGQRIEHLTVFLGPECPLLDINASRVDQLVTALERKPRANNKRGKPLSGATVNRYLAALSKLLDYALERDLIPKKPKLPWRKEGQGRLVWFEPKEQEALEAELTRRGHHEDVVAVRVLAVTGMRVGELLKLTPKDINPDAGWVRLWDTKNGTPRSQPIPTDLARDLRALVASKGLPTDHRLREHIQASCKALGITKGLTTHSLRHTTATRLVANGVHIAVVQKYMGHKTINTTLRYAHVNDGQLRDALGSLTGGRKDGV